MQQWKEQDFFWGEDDFEEKMDKIGVPFQKEHYEDGYLKSYDGTKIHFTVIKNKKERAAIVISHGFCEFISKYDEMIYYFYKLGYSVYFIDHRGHGGSERMTDDPGKVCIRNFDEYVGDLREFMEQVVKVRSPDSRYLLFAHSMGGAIGTLFLEKYPEYFSAAVLSSPMMALYFGGIPFWAVNVMAVWSVLARWQLRYAPGQHDFDNCYAFETSSALSEPRYAYVFKKRQENKRYQTYGGTYSWTNAGLKASRQLLRNADKVRVPVLLLQAGRDTLVKPKEQEIFAGRSKNTTLVRYPESRHEIFNALLETRQDYYHRIFSFMEVAE